MMSSLHSYAIFTAAAIAWLGGWCFPAFRYAEPPAKINARFGIEWMSAAAIRKMVIAEIVLATISVVALLTRAAFGYASF